MGTLLLPMFFSRSLLGEIKLEVRCLDRLPRNNPVFLSMSQFFKFLSPRYAREILALGFLQCRLPESRFHFLYIHSTTPVSMVC
jgi:hypothetical protein